ncbi:MFS transporter [Mycobacterium sp. M1]|uniref:MFS transporter n=1 Tax=Mycolicibacter acidiphilus TaxID=2835306 RepID=A0ABS5RLN5_9MYCO|nr:MFS transporter [Mycolicibacter acidiphilus]MBS9535136.1 MFS transporter [Mycolicibacter acidiphilus]
MMVGFFMILVDSTIVAVANPSIMVALDIGYDAVIWVTSAYLLAYAVPLLVAGRLGDRFGPKTLYLIGLVVFTGASLWCGLSGSVGMLIIARAVQGVGAALLTPQTLTMITRIFPVERRGMAMSVWGATAGVATLIGPLAGGVLVDGLGWEWIFFVNVPIGVIGLILAAVLVPSLPAHRHRFDVLGVALSGAGMFLVVFALQEGQSKGWPPWIWGMVAGGVVLLAVFVNWQAINTREPLVPLHIFRDLDFSLANLAVAVIGFASTAMVLPVMFYAQAVCGLSPTRSAVLTAPMAIATGVLAPVVGKVVDRAHPRSVVGFGFSVLAIALTWLSIEMTPTTPIWRLALVFAAIGVGMAFIWSPLAATATRNLDPHLAGAGSGVYNATRQVGAVLGSAGMAAFMTARIADDMPRMPGGPPVGAVLRLPEQLHEPFAAAMSESTLLPAFITLFGVLAAIFLVGFVISPAHQPHWSLAGAGGDTPGPIDDVDDFDDPGGFNAFDGYDEVAAYEFGDGYDEFGDELDDEPDPVPDPFDAVYCNAPTELIPRIVDHRPEPRRRHRYREDPEPVTEPLTVVIQRIPPEPDPEPEPLAHNGFHVEGGRHFQRPPNGSPVPDILAKYGIRNVAAHRNRHYRRDPDDTDEIERSTRRGGRP